MAGDGRRRVRDGDIVCEGWASVHGLDEAVQQEALARWHAGLR